MRTPANLSQMARKELEAFARAAVLRNEKLERRVAEAERRAMDAERCVADLVRRVAELEARLKEPPKTSGNSSLPPSKDFKANAQPSERTGPRNPLDAMKARWNHIQGTLFLSAFRNGPISAWRGGPLKCAGVCV